MLTCWLNWLQRAGLVREVVAGTPVAKPSPVFVKLDESIVDEELSRYADQLPCR